MLYCFLFHMMNCAQWTTAGELLCNCIMSILPTYCSYTLYVIYIITCVCNSRLAQIIHVYISEQMNLLIVVRMYVHINI